jgi:hypothetical protein
MDIVEKLWELAAANLDLLLIAGTVVLIQAMKKAFPKFPTKAWMLVMIALGFLIAWLEVPVVAGHVKEFIQAGIKYAAGAELLYQGWRTIAGIAKARITGRKG